MTRESRIIVPRVIVHGDSSAITRPTAGDLEGGVLANLIKSTHIIDAGKAHELIGYPAPVGHHPHPKTPHTVYWVAERRENDGQIAPWTPQSLRLAASDSELMMTIQNLRGIIGRPDTAVYGYLGFALPEENGNHSNSHHTRGLQSQLRLHFHACDYLDVTDKLHDNVLIPSQQQDAEAITRILNTSGELALAHYAWLLKRFEKMRKRYHMTYKTKKGADINADMTIFAFPSLQEAMIETLELFDQIKQDWIRTTTDLGEKYRFTAPQLDGIGTRFKQSVVPNAGFYLPTDKDRKRGEVEGKEPVWLMLFPVSGWMEMLNGISLERQ